MKSILVSPYLINVKVDAHIIVISPVHLFSHHKGECEREEGFEIS